MVAVVVVGCRMKSQKTREGPCVCGFTRTHVVKVFVPFSVKVSKDPTSPFWTKSGPGHRCWEGGGGGEV